MIWFACACELLLIVIINPHREQLQKIDKLLRTFPVVLAKKYIVILFKNYLNIHSLGSFFTEFKAMISLNSWCVRHVIAAISDDINKGANETWPPNHSPFKSVWIGYKRITL